MNTSSTKPVVGWAGGKRLLAKHILPLFPKHHAYVEVFGGSLALLCAKERSSMEIVNDINGELICFYRVVRYHLHPLLEELEWEPNSRQVFNDLKNQRGLTDIQRAARWYYLNKNSFAGFGENFGTGKTSGGASHASRVARLEALQQFNQRLDRVCIENLDWRKLLRVYDARTTLFYLDPPYVTGSQDCYVQRWGEKDHHELRAAIARLQGKWVLSYCDCAFIRTLYKGCTFKAISRARGIGNNHGRKLAPFKELIITPK